MFRRTYRFVQTTTFYYGAWGLCAALLVGGCIGLDDAPGGATANGTSSAVGSTGASSDAGLSSEPAQGSTTGSTPNLTTSTGMGTASSNPTTGVPSTDIATDRTGTQADTTMPATTAPDTTAATTTGVTTSSSGVTSSSTTMSSSSSSSSSSADSTSARDSSSSSSSSTDTGPQRSCDDIPWGQGQVVARHEAAGFVDTNGDDSLETETAPAGMCELHLSGRKCGLVLSGFHG